MKRDIKVAVVIIVILVLAMLFYYLLTRPQMDDTNGEFEPDPSWFVVRDLDRVRNETGWLVYVNISYDHLTYEECVSHNCSKVIFTLFIKLADNSSGFNVTEPQQLETVPEDYTGIVMMRYFYLEPREPIQVTVWSVECSE